MTEHEEVTVADAERVDAVRQTAEAMSDTHLDAIQVRAGRACRCDDHDCVAEFVQLVDEDVPALIAEVKRLNTVLDANRVVRNAAESSSRTYKAVTERLKAERTRLRGELSKCGELNRELVNENAELREHLAKHQPGPVLRAWRGDNGDVIHGDRGWIRQAIKTHGGQHVIANTCTHVSDWREVDGG